VNNSPVSCQTSPAPSDISDASPNPPPKKKFREPEPEIKEVPPPKPLPVKEDEPIESEKRESRRGRHKCFKCKFHGTRDGIVRHIQGNYL
jgi:hypothetical protein